MGHAKDVKTAADADTMATKRETSPYTSDESYVRTEPRPLKADDPDNNATHADNGLQVEEPGYGYGV
jgi:hypothetical protein